MDQSSVFLFSTCLHTQQRSNYNQPQLQAGDRNEKRGENKAALLNVTSLVDDWPARHRGNSSWAILRTQKPIRSVSSFHTLNPTPRGKRRKKNPPIWCGSLERLKTHIVQK